MVYTVLLADKNIPVNSGNVRNQYSTKLLDGNSIRECTTSQFTFDEYNCTFSRNAFNLRARTVSGDFYLVLAKNDHNPPKISIKLAIVRLLDNNSVVYSSNQE